jgi:DNA-binding FadR family transcriptional regulator
MRRSNALSVVRRYIHEREFRYLDRLPPERDLAEHLGLTRSQVRTVLDQFEAEGLVWRHVGKGTFFGPKPTEASDSLNSALAVTNPRELMETRLAVEPPLAKLATHNGSARDFDAMKTVLKSWREGSDIETFKKCDEEFHLKIAQAAGNGILLAVFVGVNSTKFKVLWGRLREFSLTAARRAEYHRHHEEIFESLCSRDASQAEDRMRRHLEIVQERLFGTGAPTAGDRGIARLATAFVESE